MGAHVLCALRRGKAQRATFNPSTCHQQLPQLVDEMEATNMTSKTQHQHQIKHMFYVFDEAKHT